MFLGCDLSADLRTLHWSKSNGGAAILSARNGTTLCGFDLFDGHRAPLRMGTLHSKDPWESNLETYSWRSHRYRRALLYIYSQPYRDPWVLPDRIGYIGNHL